MERTSAALPVEPRPETEAVDREFILSRTLDAPRDLVFRAWTNPGQLARWWGPKDFTNPFCEMDVRPGGAYRIVMRGPDGVEYPVKGVYREVVEPERLAMTDDCSEHPAEWKELLSASLPEGARPRSSEAYNTVTFEEEKGRTLLTLRTLFESREVRDAMLKMGMAKGWSQSLDRLEAILASGDELVVTRVVRAPRDAVFHAWTDSGLVGGWWRPKGFEPPVVERLDVKPGGGFRFLMRYSDGVIYTARGVYREVQAPERLVYDDYCDEEGKTFHRALLTVTFDEHAQGTKITIRGRFLWVSDRDPRWTPDAMEAVWLAGWNDTLNLLDAQLAVAQAA